MLRLSQIPSNNFPIGTQKTPQVKIGIPTWFLHDTRDVANGVTVGTEITERTNPTKQKSTVVEAIEQEAIEVAAITKATNI